MAQNGTLTAKQQQLIRALMQGSSVADAAALCQVAKRTAYRWMELPEMQEALKVGQQELFEASLENLKRLMPKAVETLEKHMNAPVMVTAATSLGAARTLIETGIAVHRSEELEARITELEEALRENKP